MFRTSRWAALLACFAALAPAHAYFEGPHLDTTYGTSGTAAIPTNGNQWHVYSMHAGRSGALAVLYLTTLAANGGPTAYMTSRLLPNGAVDMGFGDQGRVDVTRLGGLQSDTEFRASAVVTDREGRVVLAGQRLNPNIGDPGNTLMVGRLTPGGTTDATFGSAGAVTWPLPQPSGATACNGYVSVTGIAQRPDGKLLVYGTRMEMSDFGFSFGRCMFLAQFNADGSRDVAFGSGGLAETIHGGSVRMESGALLADGSFMGLANTGFVTWKVDATGRTTVASGAPPQTPFPSQRVFAQAPGTFIESRFETRDFTAANRFALEIRHADGSLNTAAGDQGFMRAQAVTDGHSFAAMTPDGGAVATGTTREVGVGGVIHVRHHLCVWRSEGRLELCGAIGPRTNAVSSTTYLGPDGSLYVSNNTPVVMPDGSRAGVIGRFNVTAPIVEFYNAGLAHFYMTYDGVEARWIDGGGAGAGWTRTGQSFKSGGTDPACMFYGTPGIGPNSHFYTINPAECEWVKLDPGWTFIAMSFYASQPAGGQCAPPLRPIHRLYNNRAAQNDSNHRYIRDPSLADGMLSQGWTYDGIVFCVRP